MNYTFDFSGNASLKDNDLAENNFQSSDFTLQCWIKTSTLGEIISKTSKDISFSLSVNAQGNIIFSVVTETETRTIIASNVSVIDDHWYHITAIKTTNFLELYINNHTFAIENNTEVIKMVHNVETFSIGGSSKENFFQGVISQVAIWNKALLENEVSNITEEVDVTGTEGLLKICNLVDESKESFLPDNFGITVTLKIRNTTFEPLILKESTNHGTYIPEIIEVGDEVTIFLRSGLFSVIRGEFRYENSSGNTFITIIKNFNQYNTVISVVSDKDLIDDLAIKVNLPLISEAELVIGENMVVVNMRNLHNFLNGLRGHLKCDQIQTPGGNLIDEIEYNKASQVFNRRFQLKPYAIIYCESTKDVQRIYKDAIANNLPIRVRSGGHDHEAECSGTDVVLIDLSRINHVKVNHNKTLAHIGPGNRFKDLTPKLALEDVMLPHGTCATVGVAGFTFGGGWGPWTRKRGMNCEGLVGATIVLGNGEVVQLKTDDRNKKDLLWALKGGGGMSYGIVTELKLKVFPLPKILIKFELEWNPYDKKKPWIFEEKESTPVATKIIIEMWEKVIINKDNKYSGGDDFTNDQLIGTNLKVSGKHLKGNPEDFKPENEIHNCIMYGYWQGTEASLKLFVKSCFADALPEELRIVGKGGQRLDYAADGLMSSWDRESFSAIKRTIKLANHDATSENGVPTTTKMQEATYDKIYKIGKLLSENSASDIANKLFELVSTKKPLPPDLDAPAPHKITSRFANKVNYDENGEETEILGLGENGIKQLISSLTSKLIVDENRAKGLFTYITLGAIVGEFYDQMSVEDKEKSAFPYKDKAYTIQYQTWWNTELLQKEKEEDNYVYKQTNRALDWMQVCRDYEIENSSGAFISFKDASIPTETYFAHNYQALKDIKIVYSKDPFNHFRTRKTIL